MICSEKARPILSRFFRPPSPRDLEQIPHARRIVLRPHLVSKPRYELLLATGLLVGAAAAEFRAIQRLVLPLLFGGQFPAAVAAVAMTLVWALGAALAAAGVQRSFSASSHLGGVILRGGHQNRLLALRVGRALAILPTKWSSVLPRREYSWYLQIPFRTFSLDVRSVRHATFGITDGPFPVGLVALYYKPAPPTPGRVPHFRRLCGPLHVPVPPGPAGANAAGKLLSWLLDIEPIEAARDVRLQWASYSSAAGNAVRARKPCETLCQMCWQDGFRHYGSLMWQVALFQQLMVHLMLGMGTCVACVSLWYGGIAGMLQLVSCVICFAAGVFVDPFRLAPPSSARRALRRWSRAVQAGRAWITLRSVSAIVVCAFDLELVSLLIGAFSAGCGGAFLVWVPGWL